MTLLLYAPTADAAGQTTAPFTRIARWVAAALPDCFLLLITHGAPQTPLRLANADWVTLPAVPTAPRPDGPSLRMLERYATMYRPAASVFVGEGCTWALEGIGAAFGERIWLREDAAAPRAAVGDPVQLALDPQLALASAEGSFGGAPSEPCLLDLLRERVPVSVLLERGAMRERVERALDARRDAPLLELWVAGPVTPEVMEVIALAESRFPGPIRVELGIASSLFGKQALAATRLGKYLGRASRVRVAFVSEVAPPIANQGVERALRWVYARSHGPKGAG